VLNADALPTTPQHIALFGKHAENSQLDAPLLLPAQPWSQSLKVVNAADCVSSCDNVLLLEM
jgi:hypothetical protein